MTKAPKTNPDEVRAFHAYLALHAQGRANAKTARQVANGMRLPPLNADRRLRAWAHAAADQGLLIVADNSGYFLPGDATEIAEAVGRLRAQGNQMLDRARRIEALADRQLRARQASFL